MQIPENLIPAAKLAAVEKALFKTFDTTAVEEIILLTGGLSASAVYRIKVNDQYYVLKLDNPVPVIQDDQLSCMEIAAAAGIAPAVYHLDKAAGVTITGFIPPVPLVFDHPDKLLSELAKTIRRIHELPYFPHENSLQDTVDGLIGQFKMSGMLTGPVFDECFAHYETIRQQYPWFDTDKVSSHNDLNPNNMVFDGKKIWIIDWDAAFKNDRYVDLAITANFYITTQEQEELFLETYFGRDLHSYHRARFFVMRLVCRLVYAMLMFKLADGSKTGGIKHNPEMNNISLKELKIQLGSGALSLADYNGQMFFGKALMNEALHYMQSPRFAQSIALL
ncbi:hypothetical protein TH53_09900 [Pedobacter lusitanus]|uniref:Aminoglycoside phosphotransferase domain-containing protein n=1 Tax=Pedobacter lusitanus TaxID=1503925 RepID=A0A0D0FXW3_9SPHI|nr:phosphotransferase [Pedobacter lusitanus]KIO77344.1 hypothetical protein TH53_09900 [Pedobacter lusitanus]